MTSVPPPTKGDRVLSSAGDVCGTILSVSLSRAEAVIQWDGYEGTNTYDVHVAWRMKQALASR
jgi:hypothetical protein